MSKGNRMTKGEKAQVWLTEKSPFPRKLRYLLKSRGVTQKELAEAVGVTRQSISMYASGQTVPDIYTAQLIADFFGEKIGYLLSDEDYKLFHNIEEFKDICTAYAGSDLYNLFCEILRLNDAGRGKVIERVGELLEIKRYNVIAEEYEADSAKDRPEYYGYNPNEEDGK